MLEYNILRDENEDKLVKLINEALELGIGWVPQGGLVYISNPQRGFYFAQAMVREIGCIVSPREIGCTVSPREIGCTVSPREIDE